MEKLPASVLPERRHRLATPPLASEGAALQWDLTCGCSQQSLVLLLQSLHLLQQSRLLPLLQNRHRPLSMGLARG